MDGRRQMPLRPFARSFASQERLRNLKPGRPRTLPGPLSRLHDNDSLRTRGKQERQQCIVLNWKTAVAIASRRLPGRPAARASRNCVPGRSRSRRCLMTHLRNGPSASFMASWLLERPHERSERAPAASRGVHAVRATSLAIKLERHSFPRDHLDEENAIACPARPRGAARGPRSNPESSIPLFQTGLLCLAAAFSKRRPLNLPITFNSS